MAAALLTLAAGHSAVSMLLAYAVIGSLGTLFIAAVLGRRRPDNAAALY
jgi:hypothetical protein